MKPRIPPRGLLLFDTPFTTYGRCRIPRISVPRPSSRHVSSESTTSPKHRRWVRLAIVTIGAAGIGAYIRSQQASESPILNPLSFTKYHIVSREPVSSTGSIFTLKPDNPDGNNEVYEKAFSMGIWSVMFKQPQLQIGRDYTPLPPTSSSQDEGSLRFFIRRDPFGEVSRYLHGLDLGTAVEVRGPQLEYEIPNGIKQVLFIAGGTGIAPALQACYTLLRRTDHTSKPRIHILWANRRREDCLGGRNDTVGVTGWKSWLSGIFDWRQSASGPVDIPEGSTPSIVVRELEALKTEYPGQLTVDYFVDEEHKFIEKQAISDFTNTRSGSDGAQGKLILVSGPEGFISYMAGPKVWAQGAELQGPLRGIIRELNLSDWAVWKL
ncbi:hypothetical protein PHISCL_06370 [Aspergillus sclerotialis]|uniref:FAD-binding FR-type domain-containing protein n=1 Tax=Aspergillus sclerotialis TaxID=2070753 RepID=A0A3A2ZW93_9EURO|nr:hypothetical protein PHISCL_06370 [Aspergillus sclerotialis]